MDEPKDQAGTKNWVPAALGILIFTVFAIFLSLELQDGHGTVSFGVANTLGLVAVVVGVTSAGILLRRARPPS